VRIKDVEYNSTYGFHKACVRTNEEKTMAAKVSLLGMMTEKEKERILAKCDGDIFGDECVMPSLKSGLKRGHDMVKGNQHPKVSFRGRNVALTRLLYHNYVGKITKENPYILHKCDTDGRCVCLKHLYAGTAKQNAADRMAHGNHYKNGTTPKLTKDNVKEIRKRYRDGETQSQIAKKFKIDQTNVSQIVLRKSWAWLE